jgi:diguanylate cyclase (GGDEF)-like protein/PAS domain S-box-containing protein
MPAQADSSSLSPCPSGWRQLALLPSRPLQVEQFLRFALDICDALVHLHRTEGCYGQLTPETIFVCQSTWQVQLPGIAPADQLLGEGAHFVPTGPALPYVAPEQSGRINQRLDARSDCYSLGVIFYQLLTGSLPFEANDPLEWMHAHLAREPPAPHVRNAAVPTTLSVIVMKMLEKSPDKRYQGIAGLLADVAQCWRQWTSQGTITPFAVGRYDVAGGLRTLHRLYGRDNAIAAMVDAYERVVDRGIPELLLLAGPAGVGKSAVIAEFENEVNARGGAFIAGKFDQYKGQTPYATLCEALSQLVQTLLAGDEQSLRTSRERLNLALGGNGALVLDLIPQARLLLGDQPVPAPLPPKEAQRRFFATLRNFIAALTGRAQPLVIFLDDLQWTDKDTLSFLDYMLADSGTLKLLVTGTYRDNEITPSHPLAQAMQRMHGTGLPISKMSLPPLTNADFTAMIGDVLGIAPDRAMPLAATVHKKTAGIPLFALHFLNRLEREGILRFEPASASWEWDIDAIDAQGYSDNVIDLMLAAIKVQLSKGALELLQVAACIGYVVDLSLLAKVHGDMPEKAVRTLLREALDAGFVDLADRTSLRFAHDRIQQAVYAFIPRARRNAIHLEIARRMLAAQADGGIEDRVFEMADQFNLGSASIADDQERRQLMQLNLRAGTRAKAASAHASASHYLAKGLQHFHRGDFEADYRTAYFLHFEQASCTYLLGHADEAGQLLEQVLQHTRGTADRARALHLKIELLSAKAKYTEAFEALVECTSLFGIALSDAVTSDQATAEEAKFWQALGKRPIESLASVPAPTDDAYEFLLDSLLIAMPLANVKGDALFHLMVAHAVNISLRHGSAGQSALSYALLGAICCTRGDFEVASRLEKLARDLIGGFVPERYRAPVLLTLGALIGPFTRPLRDALDDLHASFESGRISDEPVAANLACQYIIEQRCSLGDPLAVVLQDADSRIDFARRTAYTPTRPVLEALRTYIRNLRGQTRHAPSFDADDFSERSFEDQLDNTAASPLHFTYYSLKLQARFIFGDYANARQAAMKAHSYYRFALGSYQAAEFHFYQALSAAALCRTLAPHSEEWQQQRAVLYLGCERLAEWMRHSPDDLAARCYLAQAERAYVDGDKYAAIGLYMQAIESAHAQGASHITALAHELAAFVCRDYRMPRIGDTLVAAAVNEFGRWGADAKVAQLRQRFPADSAFMEQVSIDDAFSQPERLDLLAMAKVAQSISDEVTTGRLHETLLRTLLENVGAQSAHLLQWQDGEMHLRESAHFQNDRFYVEQPQALPATSDRVPETVVNYVARARVPLRLDDACREGVFMHDSYFGSKQQCAVLCMPILRQHNLMGVLYLENSRLAGAFARVNLEVLEWLLAHVAISMENAGLYENLQESESLLTAVMDNVPACVYMKDLDARYLYINREFEKLIGLNLADILGQTDYEILQDQPELADSIRKNDMIAIRGGTVSVEESFPVSDGATHTFLSVKTPLYHDNEIKGLCGISMDISEQKQASERIAYLAHYDVLTGLPNRHLLSDRLDQAIAEARRTGNQVGLMVLDLDRFKIINDSLGHGAGDLLLQQVAAKLKASVHDWDTVARLGGDAFVVIATGLVGVDDVRQVASRIIESISGPFHLNGHLVSTGGCVGISLFPQDADKGETLLKFAEMAMYHAKDKGQNALQFYDEAMDKRAQERLALENELRTALANNELFLLYQPQVNLRDHHVTGAEALVRWQHPEKGLISPARFIPLAEECGLISEITRWIISEVCAQQRKWQDAGLPHVTLAINVSALNVQQDDLYHSIESALAIQGLGGGCLELEMTEGTLMKDMEVSIQKLVELKRLGIRVSIDDFGTGYSSLSYLKRLPVDKLKIDQSFVRDIAHEPNDAAITSAIIAMGKQLNLKVIAEGVEDIDAERFLLKHRCDQMQGYLFSPPVSADAFAGMLS